MVRALSRGRVFILPGMELIRQLARLPDQRSSLRGDAEGVAGDVLVESPEEVGVFTGAVGEGGEQLRRQAQVRCERGTGFPNRRACPLPRYA
ncbi:hypothetical protein GCM10022294_00540 [Dietzia aurantiaca]